MSFLYDKDIMDIKLPFFGVFFTLFIENLNFRRKFCHQKGNFQGKCPEKATSDNELNF